MKIDEGQYLQEGIKQINGVWVQPYLVADSAFTLSQSLIKGFPYPPAPANRRFNAAVVTARRVVEQAFGDTKKRFAILSRGNIRDPYFAADVALVCCAMHNVCIRAANPAKTTYLPNPAMYQTRYGPDRGLVGTANQIIAALAATL